MFRLRLHLSDGYYFITIACKMANYAHISQSVVVVSLVRYTIYPRKVALTCVERVKDLLLRLTHSNYNRSLYNLNIYFPVCLEDKFGTKFTMFFLILFFLSSFLFTFLLQISWVFPFGNQKPWQVIPSTKPKSFTVVFQRSIMTCGCDISDLIK